MSIGTRNPRPIGPEIAGLPMEVGSGTAAAVTYSPGVPGGAVVGGHMIEESAIFIKSEEKSSLRPDRWIRHQRSHNQRQYIFAKQGRRGRMI